MYMDDGKRTTDNGAVEQERVDKSEKIRETTLEILRWLYGYVKGIKRDDITHGNE